MSNEKPEGALSPANGYRAAVSDAAWRALHAPDFATKDDARMVASAYCTLRELIVVMRDRHRLRGLKKKRPSHASVCAELREILVWPEHEHDNEKLNSRAQDKETK